MAKEKFMQIKLLKFDEIFDVNILNNFFYLQESRDENFPNFKMEMYFFLIFIVTFLKSHT